MYLHMYTGRNLYMIPLILHTILRHIWGVSICSNIQLVSSISSRSYSDVLSVNCEQKWEACHHSNFCCVYCNSWFARDNGETLYSLASFPGLPWLQFLIACSMQKSSHCDPMCMANSQWFSQTYALTESFKAIKNWSHGRPGNKANIVWQPGKVIPGVGSN